MRSRLLIATAAFALMMTGCTSMSTAPEPVASAPAGDADGPQFEFLDAGADGVTVRDGDDWSLPSWVRPAANSGFFSEEASVDDRVLVRSIDVSWRQVQPSSASSIDWDSDGSAQGMQFASLRSQLDDPSAFWMRIFASGEDWAPEWVSEECAVGSVGPDYDGQRHLPIWNECVWSHLMDTYRSVFVDGGLAADPRLKFVYVPGAFTWAEFDYEMITAAVEAGDLDFAQYSAWYSHAWTDLVELFGEHSDKLVFTGEDYPFGPFGADDDLLAADAVAAGLGIRTGITELSNFHLSEAPAYGSSIQPNGHLVVDESLPIHDGRRVIATENECFTDCGYQTDDPYYAVRQANLKSLQLRMNWMYVVPEPSYFPQFPEHWDWVRLSLGARAGTSADAWAALRDASDTYWAGEAPAGLAPGDWPDRPFVRNLERWIVQRDEPGSVAHRSDADVHVEVFEPDNGTAHEGLSTSVAEGDTGLVFDVDEAFRAAGGTLVAKVTFLDEGAGSFTVDSADAVSAAVERTDSGAWRTATVALPEGVDDAFRVSLSPGADDLVVRFVRLVRVTETD
ncbi:MAG: hypothetical protein ACOH19_11195 [Rhodoglobus sp.]